jgi:hypothetical protein
MNNTYFAVKIKLGNEKEVTSFFYMQVSRKK